MTLEGPVHNDPVVQASPGFAFGAFGAARGLVCKGRQDRRGVALALMRNPQS